MTTEQKVPVGMKALVARVNRRLDRKGQVLMKSRSDAARKELGDWYLQDRRAMSVVETNVDPQVLARELGVLGGHEVVVS